jgi:predicted metal-dependent phosphotriesterase family hydrolase
MKPGDLSSRRKFVKNTCRLAAVFACLPRSVWSHASQVPAIHHDVKGPGENLINGGQNISPDNLVVVTVAGPRAAAELGFTLSHEHIMVDFIGAAAVSPNRYNAGEVFNTALPFLQEVRERGCRTIVDCTPAYLGRDVTILKKLADAARLNILTNTGYYGAAGEKYLPPHAYTDTVSDIANRWIREWQQGIDGTGIKPGFIKSGVDRYPLSAVQQKIVAAAAETHAQTGLTLAIHTGDGKAALEEMKIIHNHGVHASAWIWVHAQSEENRKIHLEVASAGGWVSFDGYSKSQDEKYIQFIKDMKQAGHLNRILISHDSGWYHVGEPGGGRYNNYNAITDTLIPALGTNGFTNEDVRQIFELNPAIAYAVSKRLLKKN